MEKLKKTFNLFLTFPLVNEEIDNINRHSEYPELVYYIQEYPKIPLKRQNRGGDSISGFIITPQEIDTMNPQTAAANIWEFWSSLDYIKYRNNSPYVQKKYNNTRKIMRDILTRWENIEHKVIQNKSTTSL